jgi:hypothetical protein
MIVPRVLALPICRGPSRCRHDHHHLGDDTVIK